MPFGFAVRLYNAKALAILSVRHHIQALSQPDLDYEHTDSTRKLAALIIDYWTLSEESAQVKGMTRVRNEGIGMQTQE